MKLFLRILILSTISYHNDLQKNQLLIINRLLIGGFYTFKYKGVPKAVRAREFEKSIESIVNKNTINNFGMSTSHNITFICIIMNIKNLNISSKIPLKSLICKNSIILRFIFYPEITKLLIIIRLYLFNICANW